ncbi:MAG: tetratricopeptide repeat protein [Planctomycetota bacterium]
MLRISPNAQRLRRRAIARQLVAGWLLSGAVLSGGCTLFVEGERLAESLEQSAGLLTPSDSADTMARPNGSQDVVNPPAKTIRFDGREVVLGTTDVKTLATSEFCGEVNRLLTQQRYRTATRYVQSHPEVAEQALWEKSGEREQQDLVAFISRVVSIGVPRSGSWTELQSQFARRPDQSQAYLTTRRQFVAELKQGLPEDQLAEQLRADAQSVGHPLALTDALRLLGLRELVAGRDAWAYSLLVQAAESAEQLGDRLRASDLQLLVAIAASRSEQLDASEQAWLAAVNHRLALHPTDERPLSAAFWTRAEQQRLVDTAWPDATAVKLLPHCRETGCQLGESTASQWVLWGAIANAHDRDGNPQLALVHYKKAETLAEGSNRQWLQVAQGKCLATLGQSHAAAALLSGPASSDDATIAAAATAAMGSAKLQAGAYQQGAQLLQKALQESATLSWPTRARAEADLALARLIIGETDQGLEALHKVQETFRLSSDWSSLLQSLANEKAILEQEGRVTEAQSIESRMVRLEAM